MSINRITSNNNYDLHFKSVNCDTLNYSQSVDGNYLSLSVDDGKLKAEWKNEGVDRSTTYVVGSFRSLIVQNAAIITPDFIYDYGHIYRLNGSNLSINSAGIYLVSMIVYFDISDVYVTAYTSYNNNNKEYSKVRCFNSKRVNYNNNSVKTFNIIEVTQNDVINNTNILRFHVESDKAVNIYEGGSQFTIFKIKNI